MILYGLDEVDERLEILPMAARRALDRAGRKLSLDGWKSLSLEHRRRIAEVGSAALVDVQPVIESIKGATPEAVKIDPIEDPPAANPPLSVVKVFGDDRPIGGAVWVSLRALDRYVLAKISRKGNAGRLDAAYQELIGHSALSTHLSPAGGVRMVAVSAKEVTLRRAVAESRVTMNVDAFGRLQRADAPKGDVMGTARLAGIMAAKKTSEIVPLCHPISLTRIDIELKLEPVTRAVKITADVECYDRTGVEMEAMVAASTAALTIYDMLKSFDRSMTIGMTRLVSKTGGRSGDFDQ
ncbi:MAG: cyclic pyranopterin monophosphate synthase MoaC [Polyangiaceae bacterium]|nr:cyclic pyranopterin monophosphate synthase MoaC [Polyangiaceae bacterium]